MGIKVIRLRDRSTSTQLTPNEALQEAIDSQFKADCALIIKYRDDLDPSYEFWQGGGILVEEMLWHIEQFKKALLEGRHDYY